MRIHFVLVGEGPSDDGLIPHLENLCIELGATEVTGIAPDFQRLERPIRRTVTDKLRAARQLEPTANLFFVHRDADSRDPSPRYQEINTAANNCSLESSWVAVVPVQETEAWLLLDEAAIRAVAGHPRGRSPLGLPRPHEVERIAHPKEKLKEVLVIAAELSGHRLVKFRKDFSNHRRLLLQRMAIGGVLSEVNSWVRLRSELQQAILGLQSER